LMLSIQASYQLADDHSNNNRNASIRVFTPHSQTVMLSLEVEINDLDISIINATPRAVTSIRKNSLFGDTKPTIMIVDDEPLLVSIYSRWIKSTIKSVELVIFNDGLQAVEYYKENFHVRLIFMDIQMPNLSGDAATRQIRELERLYERSPTPVVGITAMDVEFNFIKECGMTDFCTKPVKEYMFIEKLIRYLDVKSTPELPRPSAALPATSDEIDVDNTQEEDTPSLNMK